MDWNKTIFLAHASEDKKKVRVLYEKLRNAGLEPWLDEKSLLPGVNWNNEIIKAIKKSRFFIACLSNNSVAKNGYIQKELKMALEELERKASDVVYFIPALLEDVQIPDISVGTVNLRDYQAAAIFRPDGLETLIEHLRKQSNVLQEVVEKENPLFDDLRNSIMTGDLKTALPLLNKHLKDKDHDLINNAILLTSQYNRLIKDNLAGIISHEQFNLGNNRIVFSLLEIIKILEANEK